MTDVKKMDLKWKSSLTTANRRVFLICIGSLSLVSLLSYLARRIPKSFPPALEDEVAPLRLIWFR